MLVKMVVISQNFKSECLLWLPTRKTESVSFSYTNNKQWFGAETNKNITFLLLPCLADVLMKQAGNEGSEMLSCFAHYICLQPSSGQTHKMGSINIYWMITSQLITYMIIFNLTYIHFGREYKWLIWSPY